LVRAGVERAREVGFQFCVVDEYNWPSGDARDYTLCGYPSRVLERDERFGMRTLVPDRGFRPDADYVIAGRRLPSGELEAESLRLADGDRAADAVWSFTLR